MTDDYDSPIWAVVANIVHAHRFGEGGKETRIGTRKFHGGAKVYLAGGYWGMGGERVIVVGHFRGKQLITCSIKSIYLENFRVKLAYHPEVIRRLTEAPYGMEQLDGSHESKLKAEMYAEKYAENTDYWVKQRLAKWAIWKLEMDNSKI
jgi:hypothetical protein